jgi:hypothetical protein
MRFNEQSAHAARGALEESGAPAAATTRRRLVGEYALAEADGEQGAEARGPRDVQDI